jgi:hypothetical protein
VSHGAESEDEGEGQGEAEGVEVVEPKMVGGGEAEGGEDCLGQQAASGAEDEDAGKGDGPDGKLAVEKLAFGECLQQPTENEEGEDAGEVGVDKGERQSLEDGVEGVEGGGCDHDQVHERYSGVGPQEREHPAIFDWSCVGVHCRGSSCKANSGHWRAIPGLNIETRASPLGRFFTGVTAVVIVCFSMCNSGGG